MQKFKFFMIVAALLVAPMFVSAQCKYETNEVDEFTGDIKKSTVFTKIGKDNEGETVQFASVKIISKSTTTYAFYFLGNSDLGCVTKDSYVYLKLTDGRVLQLYHIGDISCEDYAFLSVLPARGELSNYKSNGAVTAEINEVMQILRTTGVEKIRIKGDTSVDLVVDNPYFIKNDIICLDN